MANVTKLNDSKAVDESKVKDTLTVAVPRKEESEEEMKVPVFLQKLEGGDDGGAKVDQYEHVTIANEKSEEITYVLRGEWVSVPISVFKQLKEKYGKSI